jgi:2-polyprenyl-3-methyl-5-hydroxy-6-metoxy-1,4-benzoquinol methylase
MSSKKNNVQRYFGSITEEWDSLYHQKNKIRGIFNRLFRKGLYERYKLTFAYCGVISGAKVLDIGCGTGLYSIEFAKRGASRVVGIDLAQPMVEFSQQKAREIGIQEICEFICGEFLTRPFEERYDIVVAMGLFDYVSEPQQFFKKIAKLSKGTFLASFPKDSLFWGTQRKIRYLIKKCPLYFYTYNQLVDLFQEAGFGKYKIISTNRGFLGICNKT